MKEKCSLLQRLCRIHCKALFKTTQERCEVHCMDDRDEASRVQCIQAYNRVEKNRFWVLYYTFAQKKSIQVCRSCHSKQDACTDYLLSRLPQQIEAFDISQESTLFTQVRVMLQDEVCTDKEESAIHFYNKIRRRYTQTATSPEKAAAIVENALFFFDPHYQARPLHHALGYRFYDVLLVLEVLVKACVAYDGSKVEKLQPYVFEELIGCEKFGVYISRALKNRRIDFTRSSTYTKEVLDEPEVCETVEEQEVEDSTLLAPLNDEQQLIYKLKYGFRLENAEFLEVIARLDYRDDKLLSCLSSEEKFYIQLRTRYDLKDDAPQMSALDVPSIKASISKKLSIEREKLQSYSYSEYMDDAKKEIYLKLVYSEPLSAKEIGVIFDRTAKQIDKKIENAKKKLKRIS